MQLERQASNSSQVRSLQSPECTVGCACRPEAQTCTLQATTVDGSAEHRQVKQDLQSKLGIPENLQRLFFQIPSSCEVEAQDTATQTQELIEDLSTGLQDWQASSSYAQLF